MAIRSGFFNSVSGDRKYDAKRFAEYFASFIGNGVFPNPSDNLQVISNNNMTVTVRPGKAWINGYILVNDDDYILSIDVADGVLKRIDRIVARYDVANRGITLAVKKGIFASTPSAPALQRDEDIYELGIADILISNGAVSITQGNITDLRMNSTYCGIVTGVVDQIDATNLFAQYDAEFRDWFAGLEDVLDENVAANLLNLINAHKADNTYQTPTIVGTQIQLIKQSDTTRLFFKLDADLSGGDITISLDAGATSKPLVDIDGVAVTELSKGFVEVVENAVNFTYAPKGSNTLDSPFDTPTMQIQPSTLLTTTSTEWVEALRVENTLGGMIHAVVIAPSQSSTAEFRMTIDGITYPVFRINSGTRNVPLAQLLLGGWVTDVSAVPAIHLPFNSSFVLEFRNDGADPRASVSYSLSTKKTKKYSIQIVTVTKPANHQIIADVVGRGKLYSVSASSSSVRLEISLDGVLLNDSAIQGSFRGDPLVVHAHRRVSNSGGGSAVAITGYTFKEGFSVTNRSLSSTGDTVQLIFLLEV